ncbi:MAG: hypothetical protein GEU90_02305 [Gemmatimonas sp.]|nr:hypothetical protein [Gemmatimonas sp.]
MAEIDVERVRPGVWPWVIGLLVLALLIWVVVEMFGGETEPMATDPAGDTTVVDIDNTRTTLP